jgi:hypothetical protein
LYKVIEIVLLSKIKERLGDDSSGGLPSNESSPVLGETVDEITPVETLQDDATLSDIVIPTSTTDDSQSNNNPYDPTIAYYNELLRKDVYLVFRLLCKLSMHTGVAQAQETDINHVVPDDELSQVSIRARTLALELLLSVLGSCGAVVQQEDIYVGLVRNHLCMSIARNGISVHPLLFELSISLFLVVIGLYRSRLVEECEILINTVYIHILEMGNSTFTQKELVLQALEKICGDPQIIIDLFLNYDCDLGCVSIFERIVNVCARCAQGGKGNSERSDAPEDGNWTSGAPVAAPVPKGIMSGIGGMHA